MFDFSFSELVLIGLIALIVLGPQRLPEVARAMGRWAARLRRFIDDVKRDINHEVQDDDLAAFRRIQEELVQTRSALKQSAHDTLADLSAPFGVDGADTRPVGAEEESVAGGPARRKEPADAVARKAPARKRSVRKKSAQVKSGTPRAAGPKTTRNSHGGARKTRPR